jgi:hypothetical protein
MLPRRVNYLVGLRLVDVVVLFWGRTMDNYGFLMIVLRESCEIVEVKPSWDVIIVPGFEVHP